MTVILTPAMQEFMHGSIFLAVSLLILWLVVKYWIGFNMTFGSTDPPEIDVLRQRLNIAEGFELDIYASDLRGARILRATESGHLLVSLTSQGKIMLLEADSNHDGKPDGRRTLIDGLNGPHGMDLFEGWLYVAETDAVGRIRLDPGTGNTSGPYETLVKNLPVGQNHWRHGLRFGPDGWMYVSVGSSCNVCIERDPRRASLLRYHPDGTGEEIFASGLRNTEGFDWQKGTGFLYGVDNGRDFLGDDFPPCELNRIEAGGFYGWPYANGNNVPDPDFGHQAPDRIKISRPPVFAFGAHTSPLGITFLNGEKLPEVYRGSALVTLHGSWNRSTKSGYAVVSL
ncbi:MAG: PQQ-dependent sugar dehydrogenase, partial [Methylococcales bacterium]